MFKAIKKRIEELDSRTEKLLQEAADERADADRTRADNDAKLAKVEQTRKELARMKEETEALGDKADRMYERAETARQELLEKLERQPARVRDEFYEFARRNNIPLEKPIPRREPPPRLH